MLLKALVKHMLSGPQWLLPGIGCFLRYVILSSDFLLTLPNFGKFYLKFFLFISFQVVLLQKVEDEDAEELVNKCPVNVFDIEDIGNGNLKFLSSYLLSL